MALVDSLRTPRVRPTRFGGNLLTLLILLAVILTSSSTLTAFGKTKYGIAALTVSAERQHVYVINGSFDRADLTFSATLTNGKALPKWITVDAKTGAFTINAPSNARGSFLQIKVTGKDPKGKEDSAEFSLAVDDVSLGCTVDANNDGLARVLDCGKKKTKLRGYVSTKNYRWSGPYGFTSDKKEPSVTVPGVYILSTKDCARQRIIEVLANDGGCKTVDNNKLPIARIDAESFTGTAPFAVDFDALFSEDPDGKIIDYVWTWDDVTATGPTPSVTFSEGSHKIMLTVTDNTGAKSSDFVTIEVNASDYVRYDEYWLEAECAEVGSMWQTNPSVTASGDGYVVSRHSSIGSAPGEGGDGYIRFTLNNVTQGEYNLFGRIDARDGQTDSYWVRVNNQKWVAWTGNINRNSGFNWSEFTQAPPYLREGTNTIDIALRESGTRLDKIYLTQGKTVPSGNGEPATNCYAPANLPPVALALASPMSGFAPLDVTFDGSQSSDPDGDITNFQWKWDGGGATGSKGRTTLSAGTYNVTLTVMDDDGASHSSEVTIEVEDRAAASGDALWLEAECATVGSNWVTKRSSAASGGSYVVALGRNAHNKAPADVPANRIGWTFNVTENGNYNLFARVDAPTASDDSYWFRINGGSWQKWSEGISTGSGFTWNKFKKSLSLKKGNNLLEFAYREDGTMLDKLYLTTTKVTPKGKGGTAINCGASNVPQSDYLEAECATAGASWHEGRSSSASNGAYLEPTGTASMTPPSSGSEIIHFQYTAGTAGDYYLYLRMYAPDAGSNSFWVKIDNGKWIEFWSDENGRNIITSGFEWEKVNDDGEVVLVSLKAGRHDIYIGNRETGTLLDKVLLSQSPIAPTGKGPSVGSCSPQSSTFTMNGASTLKSSTTEEETPSEVDMAEGVTLFPNPVVTTLNLSLNDAYSGQVDITILDVAGRELQRLTFDKAGEQLSADFNVGDLPSGLYRLRIIEGDEHKVQTFVKQ
ncbi:PKD domain-containing protein [Lewinella sp. IMCC34183]|uniref:PKD domain-containing protein n=1 Tax=Lewinella sp. IMCC34183 TaxID=2248762 RepID=UPI000E27CB07|nr:PKD domain-containing protein [Lewinella sp. IMCC34183]